MRLFVGLLLLCAALLKVVQLFVEPTAVLQSPIGWLAMPLQILLEGVIGGLALAGVYWRHLRWVATVLFAGFAVYSLILAIDGAASCECFGPIRISPRWTFCVDVAVVIGLVWSSWSDRQQTDLCAETGLRQKFVVRHDRIVAATVVFLSVGCAAVVAWYVAPHRLDGGGSLSMIGNVTVLEPETWIGKRLPISSYINLDLSRGRWCVLLHRSNCPECQAVIPQYEALARRLLEEQGQVAIVEVPPFSAPTVPSQHQCICGRLAGDREWFVHTPFEIQLQDGVVVEASARLPALFASSREAPDAPSNE